MKPLIVFISLFISVYCNAQSLKITIYNKTGYDVDSVYIASTYVGSIKKGDSTIVLNCKKLTLQDGVPFGFFEGGTIKNKVHKPYPQNVGWCGTGVHSETTGEYKFYIAYGEDKEGYSLWWDWHK